MTKLKIRIESELYAKTNEEKRGVRVLFEEENGEIDLQKCNDSTWKQLAEISNNNFSPECLQIQKKSQEQKIQLKICS